MPIIFMISNDSFIKSYTNFLNCSQFYFTNVILFQYYMVCFPSLYNKVHIGKLNFLAHILSMHTSRVAYWVAEILSGFEWTCLKLAHLPGENTTVSPELPLPECSILFHPFSCSYTSFSKHMSFSS